MSAPPRPASPPPVVPAPRGPWDRPWALALGAGLLAAALLGAYAQTFHVPFLLDDVASIEKNATLHRLATGWFPPAKSGITVSGRPLLNFSFAFNRWLTGPGVGGYHVGNLLIHFAAALCLFGLVRRTFRLPSLAGRFAADATPLAWLAAALWALHPLQTESVTYLVQRAESLVGLCYLFTLYAFVRSVGPPSRAWPLLAVAACFLGMAAKEVMASAPLVLLLFDRTFVSGSWREVWRRHRALHFAFAASWLLLLGLVAGGGARGNTVGFSAITWLDYALTQGPGIATYLLHALVPVNLVFDYGAVVEQRLPFVLGGLAAVAGLLLATGLLLRQRPAAGFLGAWFFLILAPTSSVIPVATQTLADHRMYLPLAAVVVAIAAALYRWHARLAWWLLPLLTVGVALATFERNRDYRSALVLWEDTARKVPDNVRALNNLALCYGEENRLDDAIHCLTGALDQNPDYAPARSNLGVFLVRKAQTRGATPPRPLLEQGFAMLRQAIESSPDYAPFHSVYGTALFDDRQFAASLPPLARALALAPEEPVHHYNLANALTELNRDAEAEPHYLLALQADPHADDYLTNYGILLRRMKRLPESLAYLRTALQLKPDSARVHSNLGVTLLANGQTAEGIRALTEALRLDPSLPQAHYNLGNAYAETGRPAEAIVEMETYLRTAAPTAELLNNLAVQYVQTGRYAAAVAQLRRALELDPQHEASRENLGKITAALRASSAAP